MNFSDRTYHGDHCTPGNDPHLLPLKRREGILLTAAVIEFNVVVFNSTEMKPQRIDRNFALASVWRIAVCFLLAALFLYNPFLRSFRDSGSLAVGHPASHRATVGSSEMEPFAKRDSVAAPLPALQLAQAATELIISIPAPAIRAIDYEVPLLQQSSFFASLWFRPPPAA